MVHVQQCDRQQRIPDPRGLDGYYYWTNTYFWDLDNPPSGNDSNFRLSIAVANIHHTIVQRVSRRITDPPGSGTVVLNQDLNNVACNRPTTGNWTAIDICRVSLYSGGKWVGYKLLRMPLTTDEMADGLILPDVRGQLENQVNSDFLAAKICTRSGLPIDELRVSPRVHNWNLRHGTNRRARVVMFVP